jgi:glycosyltransferase involved in cell wall biosynthesis
VIRNGVDRDALPFVSHEGPVTDVGVVGNMTREVKRIDLFIRAAAVVARRYPDIRWHIIGDGHLRGGLEMLAAGLGVRDKLVFSGRVTDVAGYLGRLQVGVVCSDSEGLSNALIEYMFRGVVSIATAVGGNPELIRDGETGVLVPPGDADALAAALVRVIESPGLRQRLARAARAEIDQSCSWQRCLTEHDGIYRKASR